MATVNLYEARIRPSALVERAAGAIAANGFEALPMLALHAERAGELAWTHADPFDRLLVVQARRSTATLVTADAGVRDYGTVALIWAG